MIIKTGSCCNVHVLLEVSHSHREEICVVLDEEQGDGDDGSTVLNAHCLRFQVFIRSFLLLQQVRPKYHGQVPCCHFITWKLKGTKVKREDGEMHSKEMIYRHNINGVIRKPSQEYNGDKKGQKVFYV